MATFPGFTNPGIPSDGNTGHFAPFGNVGAPYMATLSLPRLTIGLPIWLFLISVVSSVPTPTPPSPSFKSCHDDYKVDPLLSSPISSPSSSTSLGENLKSSNQEARKKKKK